MSLNIHLIVYNWPMQQRLDARDIVPQTKRVKSPTIQPRFTLHLVAFTLWCWIYFHEFGRLLVFFSKSSFRLKTLFQENHQSVKQFGPRSDSKFCLAWSGSKLLSADYFSWQRAQTSVQWTFGNLTQGPRTVSCLICPNSDSLWPGYCITDNYFLCLNQTLTFNAPSKI